ncbi:hypothetical protein BDW02DRAFT_566274 [Decorospora gaudefroyi]|uniref:Uncharacterized protein n=1 Tax=Decorospora gaudefroyi TaxID=184978 RepID=A0A6A5KPI1_9PLEO|nr:hypothetical protein BDW02DRAFT_566274 [Decorospora gaudefroyi]
MCDQATPGLALMQERAAKTAHWLRRSWLPWRSCTFCESQVGPSSGRARFGFRITFNPPLPSLPDFLLSTFTPTYNTTKKHNKTVTKNGCLVASCASAHRRHHGNTHHNHFKSPFRVFLLGTSELKSSLAQLQFAVSHPVRLHVVHHGFPPVTMAFFTSTARLSATLEYESTRIRASSDGLCALRPTSSGLPAASASTERSSAWAYV